MITLSGNVFPLDSTGKSDASWMQIKDALGVEGTEEDPLPVHGDPDVLLYKRPPSEKIDLVALTTRAILELQSGPGNYNSNANIGKAARYGEKMLENLMGFRHSVLVGVTDLEKVQWFKVIRVNKEWFKYEVHCELNDVRGSLCAILKSSLSDLEVGLSVLTVSGVSMSQSIFWGLELQIMCSV